MSIPVAELAELKGKKVNTPDGTGKVTEVGDRFISVDLDNNKKSKFDPNEVSLIEKKKKE